VILSNDPEKPTTGNVIRVVFGPGGGRVPRDVCGGIAAAPTHAPQPNAPQPKTAVAEVFTRREASKLLRVSDAHLRALGRAGVVVASGRRRGKPAYTFQDLIALRTARELFAHRVPLREVIQAVERLRETLPRVTSPLHELRVVSEGRRVVVKLSDGPFEPSTGQRVLDFEAERPRDDVVRVLRPKRSEPRLREAFELYAKGAEMDETLSTLGEAEELYRRAIQLDPSLAMAYTNLGNVRFRRGDIAGAETLYQQALDIDPKQAEAHYNLGYVRLERGEPEKAVVFLEQAVEADPAFADGHFNLAMAYEQLNARDKAQPHWQRYLTLEPAGTWADIVRQHLR
jgi:tetratricopeptide (TPR) repeat protein